MIDTIYCTLNLYLKTIQQSKGNSYSQITVVSVKQIRATLKKGEELPTNILTKDAQGTATKVASLRNICYAWRN